MPLLPLQLQADLGTLFAAPGATHLACAQAWADAMRAYVAGIVPASTTSVPAAAALATALAAAFQTPNAAALMETAFAAFAVTLGGGMVGYTPTPPVGPVGFAAQFAGPKPANHPVAAQQIGNLIDAWLTTGTSTLVAPPNTVVPWS